MVEFRWPAPASSTKIDFALPKSIFVELAGAGHLNSTIRHKIHQQAKVGAELLPGHESLRPVPSRLEKLKHLQAMVRIALFG